MKVQNIIIVCVLLFLSITQVYSHANTYQEEVHEDAQYPKAFTLYNKEVVILSSIIGQNKCLVSQYNEQGELVYADITLNISDSGSGKITAIKDDIYTFGHNKQNLPNAKAIDILAKLNQGQLKSTKNTSCCMNIFFLL